ncbi:MAG: ATP-binding protein, partial [Lachnospiraceae bacterium]|nr:ATP-binding protein [Lachnospiraceae bacterium]
PDKTSDAYVLTRQLYVIYALALPLILVIQIQSNYLQATKNNIAAHVSSAVDGYFATIIPAVVLAPVIGILGVWWADPIGGVITALVYPIYAIIYWKRIPRNTDEWLLLRDDFGVKEDDRLCIDITGMEDVIGSSSRIQSFVEERGYSHRTAFFSALALEEMAGNIVSYGFGADRKKHDMDVRVVSTKNGVLLRIKDDCRAFNPVEMNQIFNPDDPSKNIGIRMISKIADEFSYQNTFGLNVLTIVIK